MTKWTEKDLADYERRRGRPLAAQHPPAAGGKGLAAEATARARGGKGALGKVGKGPSELEQILVGNFDVMGLKPIREFHMANIDDAARGWRFDFAFPNELVLVEIHGGLGFGKHSKKVGQTNDLTKANAATEHGWSVFSYGADAIRSGEAALQIQRVVLARRRLRNGGPVE